MKFKRQVLKKLTYHRKLQLLWLLAHFFFAVALIYKFSLVWLIAGLTWTIIINIGSEAGAHRLFAHKSFETTPAIRKFLLYLQTFAGEGSTLAFCGVHRLHHRYSDQPQDPHSPLFRSKASVMYWLKPTHVDPRLIKDCLTDSSIRFQHHNYFKIHFLIFIFSFALGGFKAYAYLFCLPILLILYGNGATNILGHSWGPGYRTFPTSDQSVNRTGLLNLLLMGGGLQNNHHHFPSSFTTKYLPAETDSMGWIVKRFLATDFEGKKQ